MNRVLTSILILALNLGVAKTSASVWSGTVPPDTCEMESFAHSTNLLWGIENSGVMVTDYGTRVSVYGPSELTRPSTVLRNHPVVVVVNGNNMEGLNYTWLRQHLASNKYLVIMITRKGTNHADQEQRTDILNAMTDVYEQFDIDPGSPLGFIGHSVGGGVAMELSKQISDQNFTYPFNLKALMTIAPNSELVYESNERVTAYDTPAYLSIYGSQDMDMTGTNDSFAAFEGYDFVGNEISTANPLIRNWAGELYKAMIYVHGADHKGLVGDEGTDNPQKPNSEFIHTNDQLCITKAYALAFMQWRLLDKEVFGEYFRPPYYKPPSIQQIKSNSADYMGMVAAGDNLAGSPLRMFFQSSPPEKLVVQNFERVSFQSYSDYENDNQLFKTPGLVTHLLEGGENNEFPYYIRNITNKLRISWSMNNWWQHLGFNVPVNHGDATDFTHVSLRVAQVFNSQMISFGIYANPTGEFQSAYIALKDGNGQTGFARLDDWGGIPFNDVRPIGFGDAHTGFNTISIPLSVFEQKIDISKITQVGLVFKPSTRGSILVDSLEWVKY